MKQLWVFVLAAAGIVVAECPAAEPKPLRLRAAVVRFGVTPASGGPTASRTGATVREVCGPLKTTVCLFEDGDRRLCLVASDFGSILALNVSDFLRSTIADDLRLPVSHVLLFSSDNHGSMSLASNPTLAHHTEELDKLKPDLLPVGREFLDKLRSCAKRVPGMLQPVTLWWAEGIHHTKPCNDSWVHHQRTFGLRTDDRFLYNHKPGQR